MLRIQTLRAPIGTEHRNNVSRRVTLRRVLLRFALILGSSWASSQQVHIAPRTNSSAANTGYAEPASSTSGNTFRVKVDLVLVPVTVTDPAGRFITGLREENFAVYEDKKKQAISHVSNEDAPLSLGILFDTSGSMKSKIERAREAVSEFLNTANPQDEFFLITFGDRPKDFSDFTTSPENIQNNLVFAIPKGRTALLDAIYLGLTRMRQAQYSRKALLIISDGGDNHSRYTEREIMSAVKEADTLIYAIGIYDRYCATIEEQVGPVLLSEISGETGGRMFTVDNPNDLADVATRISLELRNQYVLSYRPPTPKYDGKWHKIKIKLLLPSGLPPLQVSAKRGYYAPSQ